MSAHDPVADLLAGFDRPATPRVEFEDALRAQLLAELRVALGPSRLRPRLIAGGGSRVRVAVALVVLALVLAGVATATYFVVRGWGGGSVAVPQAPANGVDSISGIGPDGRVHIVWQCPHKVFCGDLISVAWAPDGRRLALSLTEFGAHSRYPGLHLIDTGTGRDVHLIGAAVLPTRERTPAQRAARRTALRRIQATSDRFGCLVPHGLAWSPDGSRLAYSCVVGSSLTRIYVLALRGTRATALRTGTSDAAWPSWSPDGKRLLFSTAESAPANSSVYVIDVNGSHRRLIATAGAAPVWSPSGALIAYQSACGRVRLVTPDGVDATPRNADGACRGIGPRGLPVWSPDGGTIAIGTAAGLYTINADGSGQKLVSRVSARFGPTNGLLRPAWQPKPAPPP